MSKNLRASSKKSRALKSTPAAFVKRVQNFLQKANLLAPKSKILVAVSGGPDSMALLHVLHQLSKKREWQLAIAHVNYGLRGKESEADASLVKETAEKLSLPFYLLKKKMNATSSEDALRTVRYTFFEKLVKKHNFDAVALAHHQDDQAETILMRLIRGSGSTGLAGMNMKRERYIRPFLHIPKKQILEYLAQSNVPYRLDASNTNTVYFRNKVRNVLIPLLETYNPKIKRVLAETALTLQQEKLSVDKKKNSSIFMIIQKGNRYRVDLALWQALSKGDQVKILRQLFSQNMLSLPTKRLTETILTDMVRIQKKGFNKDYSRLSLHANNGMIDIHFKELD